MSEQKPKKRKQPKPPTPEPVEETEQSEGEDDAIEYDATAAAAAASAPVAPAPAVATAGPRQSSSSSSSAASAAATAAAAAAAAAAVTSEPQQAAGAPVGWGDRKGSVAWGHRVTGTKDTLSSGKVLVQTATAPLSLIQDSVDLAAANASRELAKLSAETKDYLLVHMRSLYQLHHDAKEACQGLDPLKKDTLAQKLLRNKMYSSQENYVLVHDTISRMFQ